MLPIYSLEYNQTFRIQQLKKTQSSPPLLHPPLPPKAIISEELHFCVFLTVLKCSSIVSCMDCFLFCGEIRGLRCFVTEAFSVLHSLLLVFSHWFLCKRIFLSHNSHRHHRSWASTWYSGAAWIMAINLLSGGLTNTGVCPVLWCYERIRCLRDMVNSGWRYGLSLETWQLLTVSLFKISLSHFTHYGCLVCTMLYATFMPGTLDGPGSGGTNDYEVTGNGTLAHVCHWS